MPSRMKDTDYGTHRQAEQRPGIVTPAAPPPPAPPPKAAAAKVKAPKAQTAKEQAAVDDDPEEGWVDDEAKK